MLAYAKKTIEALKTENENLQRKVWRTEKRYRRQELSTGSSNETPSSSISHRPETPSPRKVVDSEMRNEGLTPGRYPSLRKKLLLAKCLSGEIISAGKQNCCRKN